MSGAQPCQCLAVFHPQNVVGRAKHPRRSGVGNLFHGPLPRGGKAVPGSQFLPQQVGKFRCAQCLRCPLQPLRVGAFAAEGQMRHDSGAGQHLRAAQAEALGRGDRPRQRQLQHQIRAGAHGGLRPDVLADNGKSAPLHKISAHGADNRGVRPQQIPDAGNLVEMPGMQRVIFCDNSCNWHLFTPFAAIKIIFHENLLVINAGSSSLKYQLFDMETERHGQGSVRAHRHRRPSQAQARWSAASPSWTRTCPCPPTPRPFSRRHRKAHQQGQRRGIAP
jgi:hypothetical protein